MVVVLSIRKFIATKENYHPSKGPKGERDYFDDLKIKEGFQGSVRIFPKGELSGPSTTSEARRIEKWCEVAF